MALNIPVRGNTKLAAVLERIRADEELTALWAASNITAIDRCRISDHGPTHVAIIANAALRMLRNLMEAEVVPSIVCDHKLENDDAEVVVVLAAVLHDVGHVVHRDRHADFSIPVAAPILRRLLEGLYPVDAATRIYGDVLHAIIAHQRTMKPLTVEAGVVRIADALDMEAGRSRIPFSIGQQNIHSVSALAIDDVDIESSSEKPIVLRVKMSNSAGIYQIDNLLREKVRGSGLEAHVHIVAEIAGESEKRIIERFEC